MFRPRTQTPRRGKELIMFPTGFLTEVVAVRKLADAATAGTTPVISGILDLTAMPGARVAILTSVPTDAANNHISLQHADTSTGGSVADGVRSGGTALTDNIAGSRVDAAANQGGVIYDLIPTRSQLQLTITRGTSTATSDVWAFIYYAEQLPVTQPANIIIERNANPATGTI
jgi:hypothetical protein